MTLIAGFGFRAAATAESLANALEKARAVSRANAPLDAICAPADKADAACMTAFAALSGMTVTPVGEAALTAVDTPTQAERVIEKRGVGSVAEAAAIAGGGKRLIAARVVSDDRMATCALAEG